MFFRHRPPRRAAPAGLRRCGRWPFSPSAPGAIRQCSRAARPPRLQYRISTLPNGLTVILSEDHSTPIVHVQLWYHVGRRTNGRDAPGSRTCSST